MLGGRGEPFFATVSTLVLGLGDTLPELLRTAAMQHEALEERAPVPDVKESKVALRELVEDVPEGLVPRRTVTPAEAPPLEGVETWAARHIEWELPESLSAGIGSPLLLRALSLRGEAVRGAPAGHNASVGEEFSVVLELTVTAGRQR